MSLKCKLLNITIVYWIVVNNRTLIKSSSFELTRFSCREAQRFLFFISVVMVAAMDLSRMRSFVLFHTKPPGVCSAQRETIKQCTTMTPSTMVYDSSTLFLVVWRRDSENNKVLQVHSYISTHPPTHAAEWHVIFIDSIHSQHN